jgi:hypothetical protein
MRRRLALAVFAFAVLAAFLGWSLFLRERSLNDLERENQRLRDVVARLGAEFRVADVVVDAQSGPPGRERRTTFRFLEYDRDGGALPPRTFTVAGDIAYFDALVLKFDDASVGAADPLRGRSLHLFRRVFGEYQAPADAFPIDAASPDGIPASMRADGGSFEIALWRNFWEIAADPAKAAAQGVRVAHGEAVYTRLEAGRSYRLTIEADGGLNIRPSPAASVARN